MAYREVILHELQSSDDMIKPRVRQDTVGEIKNLVQYMLVHNLANNFWSSRRPVDVFSVTIDRRFQKMY